MNEQNEQIENVGAIKDAQIWDRALTDEEVQRLYKGCCQLPTSDEIG